MIKELCKLAEVQKSRTAPYHPIRNGSAERFNISLLATLEDHQKADWKSYVVPLVQAYNTTRSDATGFSPHFLMFGWHPRLSVDAFLGTDIGHTEAAKDPKSYVRKLRGRMQYTYKVAAHEIDKNAAQNKARYDLKVRESKLELGDRVLVRKVGFQGKHKLADKWEKEPYLVTRIPNNDIPVFKVLREDGAGSARTLHRNFLLPFNVIPTNTDLTNVKVGNITKPKRQSCF